VISGEFQVGDEISAFAGPWELQVVALTMLTLRLAEEEDV
jgi:hypothetical protein